MGIGRRILSGSLANTAGIGMSAFAQLLSVPILLGAWGPEKYGVWIMLTTIPMYFALTDLGFVQAATSEMTMKFAKGEKDAALAIFQSTTVLIASMCAAAVALLVAIATAVAAMGYVMVGQNMQLIVLLCFFSAFTLLSRLPLGALRATGHYALGTLAYDLMVMLEGLAALLTAHAGGDFTAVALCLLGMRVVNMAALNMLLHRQVPWLRYGLAQARLREIRRLFKPAIAGMVIPVALATNLHGTVLVVGAIVSPAAVAVYSAVRTCSRLMIQVVGVVNRATMPEVAQAFASSENKRLGAILRMNGLLIGAVLLPGALLFAAFGKEFVELWSRGSLSPSRTFVGLMAVGTLVHGAWYFLSNMLLATNSHVSLAKYILGASVVTLLLAVVLGGSIGLNGAAIAVICGELSCLAATAVAFFSRYREGGWRGPRRHDSAERKT